MPQPIPHWSANTDSVSIISGATEHWACGAGAYPQVGGTEARIRWRTAGEISLLRTRVLSNAATGDATIVLEKNGAASGSSLTIGAGLTGTFTDSATVTVAAGDDFRYAVNGGSSGGAYTLQGVGCVFTATSNTVSRLTATGNTDMGSGTAYFSLFGAMGTASATETGTQVKTPVAGTAKNLLIRLDQNTTTGTTTVRLRKNEANTALTFNVGSGLTGIFEDTSNSESVAADDRLNYVVEGGGGGGANLSVRNLCVDFESTSNVAITGGSVTASFNPTFGSTDFTAFQGRFENTTPESTAQVTLGVQAFIRGLGLYVAANTCDGAANFRSRINGANGTSNVVIGAGLTGHFSDASGEDDIAATDLVCFAGIVGGTTGSVSANSFYYALGATGTTPIQKVTQSVLIVGYSEDFDENPPPTVTPCSGNGTVASGTNPAAGTALSTMTKPHAWAQLTIGATTYYWGKVALNGPSFRIDPRVLKFNRLARALSDDQGQFEIPVLKLRLSDYDRVIRGLMNSATLIGAAIDVYVADEATVTAGSTARRVFHGSISKYRPLSNLQCEIEAEDRISTLLTSARADERKVPARLIDSTISDQNPTEKVIGKPVPLVYGSCSDEEDDVPIGVVPCIYISSTTPSWSDDNMHRFLVQGAALKHIQSVFLADYIGGGAEPTTRIKAPESAYDSIIWVPHQSSDAPDYEDASSKRYTFIYGLDGHPAVELARSGRIPMLVNVCGIESTGDASGTMLSNPARVLLHILNNKVAQEATANWLSILSLGSYTLFDTTQWEAVATICTARSYTAAGILGHDYTQQSWRDVIADFCRNFDFDIGVNRHGQIIPTMLDRTSAYASATVFTDQSHVLKDSLDIDPRLDAVENEIRYLHTENYVEALHAITPPEGARPNRDPYDGEWFSGLQTTADETIITNMGGRPLGLRQSKVQEYNWIRSSTIADDVAGKRLTRKKSPRAWATFDVRLNDGDGVELGDVIKLTHFQGVSSTGWSARRLYVRRIEDDLDAFTRTITAEDVDNLLA